MTTRTDTLVWNRITAALVRAHLNGSAVAAITCGRIYDGPYTGHAAVIVLRGSTTPIVVPVPPGEVRSLKRICATPEPVDTQPRPLAARQLRAILNTMIEEARA